MAVLDDISQQMRQEQTLRRHVAGHALTCSVSGGLLLGDATQGDAETVMRDASIAMVGAKHQGGGRFIAFEPMLRERAMQRGRSEVELRLALAEGQMRPRRR